MSDSPTSEPEPAFVCDCEEWMRSACSGEVFYREHEGKRYCVLHYPGEIPLLRAAVVSRLHELIEPHLELLNTKSDDFKRALKRKLDKNDSDFRGVCFSDHLWFEHIDFGTEANFRAATFSGRADFAEANFGAKANFNGASFIGGANFAKASFRAEADFAGANFGWANFTGVNFGGEADFNGVNFGEKADFSFAIFNADVSFHESGFELADLFGATFSGRAFFNHAVFSAPVSFYLVTFSAEANFVAATFSARADFRFATFGDFVKFAGDPIGPMDLGLSSQIKPVFGTSSSLDFQFARIEKRNQVSFHTLRLRPHWFVNVDAREFEFTNVEWIWRPTGEEVASLRNEKVSSPNGLLAIACRQLAVNAEENQRYEEASKFRYMAMDARRLENRRGFAAWRLSWWYWLASGYGERVLKAFLVLVGIWFVAALLYTRVGSARWEPRVANESDAVIAKRDEVGAPLKFSRALTYSAGVMTLQKPEPRPATTAAQTIVLLETILGPVQAALLALAIRRKFMR